MTAKCHQGFEEILAGELKELGAVNPEIQKRAVTFEGDKELLYKVNLCSRLAMRVLIPLYTFKCVNPGQLYKGVQKIDWSKYLDVKNTLAVDSAVHSKYFTNSMYVFQKAKDAVVDQFREKFGRRPNVELDDPHLRINIYIDENHCTVSLDSSGSSLHKRGYRTEVNAAPLNEALAAGLIKISGWNGEGNFVNPMCGSGTLLIEAAMAAYNIPAGINRPDFGFRKWPDYDDLLWQKVLKEAESKIITGKLSISGADISPEAVRIARGNIRRAGLEDKISVERKDFEKQLPPQGNGIVIINPPYGERMQEDDICAFYKMMGDRLKNAFDGYDAWILSSNRDAVKSIGLKAGAKFAFRAGPLELLFNKYSMYKGL